MPRTAIAHESSPLDIIDDQIADAQGNLASAQEQQWGLVDLAKRGFEGTILGVFGIGPTIPLVEDADRCLVSLLAQKDALSQMDEPLSLNPLQEVELELAGAQARLRQLDDREKRGIQVASNSVFGGLLAVRDSIRIISERKKLLQEQADLKKRREGLARQAKQEGNWEKADPDAPVYAFGDETVHNVSVRMGAIGPFCGSERNLMNVTQDVIDQLQKEGHRVRILETIEPYPL